MCAAHKPLKPQRHPVFPAICLPLCRRRRRHLYPLPPPPLDVACRCRLVPQPFVAFWTPHYIPHPTFHIQIPLDVCPSHCPTVHIRVIVLTRQRRRQQLNT